MELMQQNKNTNESLQVVIFSLMNELYGIDISNIVEIIKTPEMTTVPNAKKFIEGVINLRGKIIVVVDLNIKLDHERQETTPETRIIVVELDNEWIGFRVQSVSETVKIQRDDIQPPPPLIAKRISSIYLDGICTLGNELLILLNINTLLKHDLNN